MPPWPRIAISVYPQARCLWTSSTWILSAAFVNRSTRKRSQRCERWLAIAETMGRTSATRPARRHPSRRARDSGRRARQSGRELRSREPDSLRQGNPVDAIELLGSYVQGIHAKDGMWPANPRELGKEVPIGKGKVDFPRIIERLRQLNYRRSEEHTSELQSRGHLVCRL